MNKTQFYTDQLQQVIAYLRNASNEGVTIEELECVSNFSYRNLQRIFKARYHESIGAYLTRIKIEKAAKLLLFSKEAIKNIAFQVGYSDVQALSKAFKKQFGISPSRYRKQKNELLSIKFNTNDTDMSFHHVRIESLNTKRVFYKSCKGDYFSDKIDTIWSELEQEAIIQEIDINKAESFGIIWDEPIITESIKCNYDACLVIPETKKIKRKNFKVKTISPNKYAVFVHIGSYKTIDKTYDKIFGQWLFNTEYEISEEPFLEFYREHQYHTDNPEEYKTEIYVPLKQ
ncbi:hypothetical protein AWE51_10800 [Aquimarina aggregata]|uniref:HTH araC/xylS-type domain-containing protein n=1 Tax=Aquimarina aggregata TaxID=1642818 RepID=A0A162YCA3_9FLAO|nr:AraC family transcriptional regulator [Aquimarina aggregata]KZS39045.1 hypothetical protein AWE51_10800 [Aquimarina aggregata]